ncbi:cytochrome C [Stutzerimonas stutzeri]|uniref:Cytochrome C n=1 Tax=Stutzerimonas stutzeri TaxID=316 RepID=W8QYE2_STUST|nr:cytochrome c [Stutzerimonas stutzeri]AHL75309.1 cytochrome C [Stutzerimonas stutzeri]MCQ4328143.1 cytochrome c [Stutzerimonas stutzeri]
MIRWSLLCALLLGLVGCDDMARQPRADAQEASTFFPDGKVNQPPPPGTVARGDLAWDTVLAERPALTVGLMQRGRERFEIYCSPCHGVAGDGNGTVVNRGFPQPPDLALPRLIEAPDRHFMNVIAHGYGQMYSYAARVLPADRWAIVSYIRALQFSRRAEVAALPEIDRKTLESLP